MWTLYKRGASSEVVPSLLTIVTRPSEINLLMIDLMFYGGSTHILTRSFSSCRPHVLKTLTTRLWWSLYVFLMIRSSSVAFTDLNPIRQLIAYKPYCVFLSIPASWTNSAESRVRSLRICRILVSVISGTLMMSLSSLAVAPCNFTSLSLESF